MPSGEPGLLSLIIRFSSLTSREYSLNNPSKITMSIPNLPSNLFSPALPFNLLSRLLPAASISCEPVNVICSTLSGRV